MNAQNWSAGTFGLDFGNVPLWNALMSLAGRPMSPEGKKVAFSFRPAPKPPQTGLVRKINFGDDRIVYLQIEQFPFSALCGVELDVEDLSNMPEPLAEALQEGMAWTLATALPDFMSEKLTLEGIIFADRLPPEADGAALNWFSFDLSGLCKEPIHFSVGAKPDDVCALLKTNHPRAQVVHAHVRSQIATSIQHIAGMATLPVNDIKALEPGDVLLFTQLAGPGERALLADGHLYTFEKAEQDWVCRSVKPFSGEETMATEAETALEEPVVPTETLAENPNENPADAAVESAAEDVSAAAKDEAPIPPVLQASISFTLGSALVPLSEIETWQVGAAVPLPEDISADNTTVTLRANGQVIAEGDLVRIDDRLAARLTRILLSGA